jgi:ubiquinone/menaquinone biosynthesis C-methylase UbiE
MDPFARALAERLDVGGDDSVVEVGAGTGALTQVLSPRVASVLATDFSPGMLAILEERLGAAGATNVRTAVMNAQDLDLEDSSFDAGACSFALMLFPDRAKGFGELCRVVRPGGKVAVSGWTGPDRFEAFGLFTSAVQKALPDLPPPPSPPAIFSLADTDRFKAEMEAAGFRDVQVELVSADLEVSGFDQAWSMLTAGAPPVQALFDAVGPEGRARVGEAFAHIVADRYGEGPFTLTNVATLGHGVAS